MRPFVSYQKRNSLVLNYLSACLLLLQYYSHPKSPATLRVWKEVTWTHAVASLRVVVATWKATVITTQSVVLDLSASTIPASGMALARSLTIAVLT